MDMTTERRDGVLTIRVAGRIDGTTSPRFGEVVLDGQDESDRAMLIDCAGLAYIGSAGLRVLMMIAKALKHRELTFVLFAMPETIRDVFQISGFDKIITSYPTEAAALAAMNDA